MNQAISVARGVQTPLLGRLFDTIKEDRRLVVMDFGTGSSALLNSLQPHRARLDVMAISTQLDVWSGLETKEERARALADYLARFKLEPSDWVLCWGMLNYLDAPMMGQLTEQLLPHLKPNARIHALVEYSSPTMPTTPPRCHLSFHEGRAHLDIETDPSTTASPRYTPKRLEGMLTGLKTENTILLSNGMQEYIFSLA